MSTITRQQFIDWFNSLPPDERVSVWYECEAMTRAEVEEQLASARCENECWRALVEWVRPTGLRSIEFDIDGFAANDEHGKQVIARLRRNNQQYAAADVTRDLAVKLGLVAKGPA